MCSTRQIAVMVYAQRFPLNAAEATCEQSSTRIGELAMSFVESLAQSNGLYYVWIPAGANEADRQARLFYHKRALFAYVRGEFNASEKALWT